MKKFVGKIKRLLFYLLSILIRCFTKIHRGRVLLWATDGLDYGCNPMYISNYLIDKNSEFEVWWMFDKSFNKQKINRELRIVIFSSVKYLLILNTAEFVITNHRTDFRGMYWKKRKYQKYIMTWHGSMPLKKIEKDAIESLYDGYETMAKYDSRACNLMLSDSDWYTKLIRCSFWYQGEILKTTMPRNDILYSSNDGVVRKKVCAFFNRPDSDNVFLLLYAPTFRTNHSVDFYIKEWENIKDILEAKTNKSVVVLLRLHPALFKLVDTNTLIKEDYVVNASVYPDMQELLVASDMLITDYSSSMFEFSLMRKPCFLYVPDRLVYDRGFYFDINQLPFPKSEAIDDLVEQIHVYNIHNDLNRVDLFFREVLGLYNIPNGCANVVQWMNNHRL